MVRIFKQFSIILILVVLSGQTSLAISKSQSKYTGSKLIDQSNNVGEWMHWAYKCGFGSKYMIAEEVGKLSWEDYKAFNSGWGKLNRLGVKNCSQNKNAAEKILDNYLKDLSNKVNEKLGKSTSTQTASSGSSSTSLFSLTDKTVCSKLDVYQKGSSTYTKYFKEAKRRGLSCGVGGSTQTASSSSSSNNTLSYLSTDKLCNYATRYGQWETDYAYSKFVQEAKRRGLTCGVGSSTQIASSGSSSNANNSLALQQAQTEAQVAKQLAQQAKQKAADLEQQLAQLQSQQQKKQQQISQDNQLPLINAMTYNDTDTNAIIQGIITDNVEVVEVTVDNLVVPLNTDGSFQTNLYIPRNGKSVEIVAIDLKGNKAVKTIQLNRNAIEQASGPVFSSLNPSGKRVKPNPNALALIIGVANYKETPAKAMYADSDAQIFYDYAMLKLGIPGSNIKELVNEGAEETDILLATKKWIARSTKQGESDIYIFFAGHGLASSDGQDMYLLPYDGSPELLEDTAILRERLFKEVASSNPRSVTVFLDTCYSGTTRGTDMLIASRPIAIVAKEQAIPDNFTVFTAAAGDQTAKPLEEAKHGLFSYFLMKGMEGEADSNNDNAITAGELHAYVQSNVIQQSSGSQTPELQGDANRVLVRFQ